MSDSPLVFSDDISPPGQNEPAVVAKANKLEEFLTMASSSQSMHEKINCLKTQRICDLR
jgi:hypothetical protein